MCVDKKLPQRNESSTLRLIFDIIFCDKGHRTLEVY